VNFGDRWNVKYKEHVPHSLLQDHVKCLWVMEREYTHDHPAEEVTPDAFIELIVNLGTPYVLQREGKLDREMPRAILVGIQSKPLIFRCEGTVKLVATRFYAWGALPFLADRGARGCSAKTYTETKSLSARSHEFGAGR
jgi:hypothetical protein